MKPRILLATLLGLAAGPAAAQGPDSLQVRFEGHGIVLRQPDLDRLPQDTVSARIHDGPELRFTGPVPTAAFEALPGVSEVAAEDHVLRMRVSGAITPVVRAAAQYELLDFVSREPTLEETFLSMYGNDADAAAPAAAGRA